MNEEFTDRADWPRFADWKDIPTPLEIIYNLSIMYNREGVKK